MNSHEPRVDETSKVRDSVLGDWTHLDERVRFTESSLGNYSYILRDSEVIYADIGRFCAIAPMCRVNATNHPTWRPAQANFTYRSMDYNLGDNDQGFFNERRRQRVRIGHDVWLGQGAIVLPGVEIGTGSVVGANSVVTRKVSEYEVVVGAPARKVRDRFPNGVREALLRIAWWNWDHSLLTDRLVDFRLDAASFAKKYDIGESRNSI